MKQERIFNFTVVVSALGYFVDIYDLLLFGIVRQKSLETLGYLGGELLEKGVFLLNCQMAGLLTGGILWGVLGDKKGRVSVLFGSILLYSLANIANAFVWNVESYGVLRFVAGIGLAGELGAAITLVSEVMSAHKRGIGTAIIASLGLLGAIFAAIVAEVFTWQQAYILGGILGIGLLVLRFKMLESGFYKKLESATVSRGQFLALFTSCERFLKFLHCVLIGVPIWFVIGILVTFSPELAKTLGVVGNIKAGSAILFAYLGLALGDISSGLLSQYLKSRRKVISRFLSLTGVLILVYFFSSNTDPKIFYGYCVALGFAVGYWAVFVTNASEQFGTNMRATVTTSVPNFVRGSLVPVSLAFQGLRPHIGVVQSALVVGMTTLFVAFYSLSQLSETFGKNLDYLENI